MARKPKYGRATENISFRPRPTNEDAIKAILAHSPDTTRSELTDELVSLGLPVFLLKKPELKDVVRAA